MQLNRIVLIGRLTRDPDESFTGDGVDLSKFALAVNRTGKPAREGDPTADFFNVVCFRQTAKFVNQYLHKGNLVAVDGRLQISEYTDREGAERKWVEVIADNVQNLTPRADASQPDRDFEDRDPSPRRDAPRAQATSGRRGFDDADDDKDPFADDAPRPPERGQRGGR
jgi:single-strand DNA-binding protein